MTWVPFLFYWPFNIPSPWPLHASSIHFRLCTNQKCAHDFQMPSSREVPSLVRHHRLNNQHSLLSQGWISPTQSHICHPLRERGCGWVLGEQPHCCHTQLSAHLTLMNPMMATLSSVLPWHPVFPLLPQPVLPKNDVRRFPSTPPNSECFHSRDEVLSSLASLVASRKTSTD